MIKIIIKRNTFASSLRNRFIVISSVPITLSRRRNRRSNMIWINTTIGMTTFWAKAIRFISFSISYKAVYISNLPDKPILVRVYGMRNYLEIANWSYCLIGFINPIGNTLASIWSLSPFLTDENCNTIDWCQFERIVRLWTIVIWNVRKLFYIST